jgi:hypothetical protein
LLRSSQPFGDLLAAGIFHVEIVVARADHEPGLRAQAAEIFPHDDGLRASVDKRGEIEVIACHHHHVEAVGNVEDPVELRKRIMEVGYQEKSHGNHRRPLAKAGRDFRLSRAGDITTAGLPPSRMATLAL